MTLEEQSLWQAIKEFDLDDTSASMTFTERLCRENSWPLTFGLRAVFEYKRFMFLVCASGHPCTPSDEVDQVWHLHLLYTQSYWDQFCQDVLKRKVHHGPTKGGNEERSKYTDYYNQTLKSYASLFGQSAPADLWPPAVTRMKFINFTRVNRHTSWILKKPKWLWT